VAIIVVLAAAGLYASLDPLRRRTGGWLLGGWLLGSSLLASVWLLNGSAAALPFTAGMLVDALAAPVACALMLAHRGGRIPSDRARTFLATVGGVIVISWVALVLISPTPPLATPLLDCGRHCPRNLLYTGVHSAFAPALRGLLLTAWVVLTTGTLAILSRRFESAGRSMRRVLLPVELVAVANVVLLIGFLIARASASPLAVPLGTAYVAILILVPAAIFGGCHIERSYLGAALARLVDRLHWATRQNLEELLAEALQDPSLKLVFRTSAGWSDATGAPVDIESAAERFAVAHIDRPDLPVAVVLYDRELAEQGHFVRAAGEAAMMALSRNELLARLDAGANELAAARREALTAALSERRALTRNLHDGAQQRVLAARMKVGRAASRLATQPAAVGVLLEQLSRDLDATLQEIRSLASSAYPPVLADYGLERALVCAGGEDGDVANVRAGPLRRHPAAVEAAVYFACMEALQNAVKHGGSPTPPQLHVWERSDELRFLVFDFGVGFDLRAQEHGNGLMNMRERIEAVGGRLSVTSPTGRGTIVSARVPVGPANADVSPARGDGGVPDGTSAEETALLTRADGVA
jgi:signal transduction histidine kinase